MVDLDRFVGDGMGTKINRLIKSMQIIIGEVQVDSLGVNIENSIAFPLSHFTPHTALLVSGETINLGNEPQLLMEFFPRFIKSKQQGLVGSGAASIVINEVVPENTLLVAGGTEFYHNSSNSYNHSIGKGVLSGDSAITLSATGYKVSGGDWTTPSCNIGWACLEFVGGVL